jgi:hypothetical protein
MIANLSYHDKPTYKMINMIKEYRDCIYDVFKKSLEHELDFTIDIFNGSQKYITSTKDGIQDNHKIYVLGKYQSDDQVFTYLNSMNDIMFDSLNKRYNFDEIFGCREDSLFLRIFSSQVNISPDDHNIIPIFIKLYNPAYNLIVFKGITDTDGIVITIYALIELKIEEHIDYSFIDMETELYQSHEENKEN